MVTIMIERPPISICLVCMKNKRFLNTGGFHTKQPFCFGIGTIIRMTLELYVRNDYVHKKASSVTPVK